MENKRLKIEKMENVQEKSILHELTNQEAAAIQGGLLASPEAYDEWLNSPRYPLDPDDLLDLLNPYGSDTSVVIIPL